MLLVNWQAKAQTIGCTNATPTVIGGAYTDPFSGTPGVISIPTAGPYHEIDASLYGGIVDFNGIYYLTQPLRLVNGTFNFAPGTVFYVRPNVGTGATVCPQYNLEPGYNFIEAEDAILNIDQTTFTNDECSEIWGGIYLRGGCILSMANSNVFNAYIGLAMDRNCNTQNSNFYRIDGSYFANNMHGVWDTYKIAGAGERISTTQFRANPYLPYIYNSNVVSGNWALYFENDASIVPHNYGAATFSGNEFVGFKDYAMHGTASNLIIDNSIFRNIGTTAIKIENDLPTLTYIFGNDISIPLTPHPANNPFSPITGIDIYEVASIENNTIYCNSPLPPPNTSPAPPQTIGVLADFRIVNARLFNNSFRDLNTALHIVDNTALTIHVEDNHFLGNHTDIMMLHSLLPPYDFYVNCNTFEKNGAVPGMYGIHIGDGTYLSKIEMIGSAGAAAGNRFINFDNPNGDWEVMNNGINPGLEYYGYGGTLEDFSPNGIGGLGGSFINMLYTGSTPCSSGGNGIQRASMQANESFNPVLGDSYPNPANYFVTVPVTLPANYTTAQLEIRELVTGRTVGRHIIKGDIEQVVLPLDNLNSGSYTYSLIVNGETQATKKMVVIK